MPKLSQSKYLFVVVCSLAIFSIQCEQQQQQQQKYQLHNQVASASGEGNVNSNSHINNKEELLMTESLINDLLQQEPSLAASLQRLPKEQRLELLRMILAAAANSGQDDEMISSNDFEGLDDDESDDDDNLASDDGDDASSPYYIKDKRSGGKSSSTLQKKDAQSLRRQAARWDIGFGKRVPGHGTPSKSKAFMDALFGKRSANSRRTSYGRRQQWDLQYGK